MKKDSINYNLTQEEYAKQAMGKARLTYEKVNSSQIRSIAYDPNWKVMGIRFWGRGNKPGREYNYYPVEFKEFEELMKAESVGSHFNNGLKKKEGIFYIEKL